MFYILSLITGILECGWIFVGVCQGMPLWQILCFPLAYHLGNLFPFPFSVKKKILNISLIVALFGSVCLLAFEINSTFSFLFQYICISIESLCIQSIRSGLKTDGNRLLKRVFRVGGFVFALLTTLNPPLFLLVISVFSIFALVKTNDMGTRVQKLKSQGGFSLVMIFHQLHYFFYAHITLTVSALLLGETKSALIFCGTWITYMTVEPIVARITPQNKPVFFFGHIGISVLLPIMAYTQSIILYIIFWLITGFGGGVVYTISGLAKKNNCYDKTSMDIAENIGHTVGLGVALLVAIFFKSSAPQIMLFFSSASAIIVVISGFNTLKRRSSDENIDSNSKANTCKI